MTLLPLDNSLLSEPTNDRFGALGARAVNCKTELSDPVLSYVRDSLAENTLRGYRLDLDRFESWGGTIPASDRVIASYLVASRVPKGRPRTRCARSGRLRC